MANKYILEFDGITCSGCITAVEKKLENLNGTNLKKIDETTGNSIIESSQEEGQLSKNLEKVEGCCSSCQISLQTINDITGKDFEFQLSKEDEHGLIKKQYKKALEKIVAKEEVACNEYCVCKTTDIDRFKEFSDAPSFSSIFNLAEVLKKFNYLHSGMSVIDFGSGTGHDSFQIAPFIAPGIITGIDVTPEMVNYAIETAKNLNISNVVFHQSANLNLVKIQSQDLIFVNNVFNILYEKSSFLKQAHEILNQKGILIIADEFEIDRLPESLRKDPAFQCGGIADAQGFDNINKLCRNNGFNEIQKEIVRKYEINYNNQRYRLKSGVLFLKKTKLKK